MHCGNPSVRVCVPQRRPNYSDLKESLTQNEAEVNKKAQHCSVAYANILWHCQTVTQVYIHTCVMNCWSFTFQQAVACDLS